MNSTQERTNRRKARKRFKLKAHNYQKLPRLSICRSNKNISAQIIDDESGITLASCSSLEKLFIGSKGYNIDGAITVGRELGKRAVNQGILGVVVDIGGYRYHGRVKAVAEAVTEAVLKAGLNKKGEKK